MQEERIGKGDTDYSDRIGQAERTGPTIKSQTKQAMQRDDEIAGVPSPDADRQSKQYALERRESLPPTKELHSHPQRQHCCDAVSDEL